MPALPADMPADAVEVGRVVGAWGVKGGFKVKPHADEPQALFSSKRWFLAAPELKPAQALPPLLRIVQAREHGDGVVATAHDIADRDAAELLAGARIFIARSSFPTPGDNEFYWVDLIGRAVVDRQGRALGNVVGLLETGPHCVLRVQPADADAAETLIPFVDAYVDRVDSGTIHVDWQPDY